MTPTDILTPVIIGMAFYGYVQCFARRLWLTLLATFALVALILWTNPFAPEQAMAWLGAVVLITAAFIAGCLERSERSEAGKASETRPTADTNRHPTPTKKRGRAQPQQKQAAKAKSKKPAKDLEQIVIDGTNVIYWDNNEPALSTLHNVVINLRSKGYAPQVFLDASTKHHLNNKSLDENAFARALGLQSASVTVCPAGTEADAFILKYAKANSLPIVSNDRFGDRAKQVKGIKLIKGVFANGKPIFDGF